MKQKWCIDFDDILADLGTGLIESVYKQTGMRHDPEEVNSWGFWWNHEHSDFIWGEQCFLSEVWTQALQPVDGACSFLQALVSKGHDRFICTNRLKTQKPWVESWIENTFNYHIPVVTTNFTKPKVEIALSKKCTHVIDDAPHQIEEYAACADKFEAIFILDKPYNRNIQLPKRAKNVFRVQTIIEVADAILKGVP